MSLFRIAVIAALGISLLPSDPERQEKLYATAANAATWTLTFCDRNGPTCEKADVMWDSFAAKAKFGAAMAMNMITDGRTQQAGEDRVIAPASLHSHGTLTPHDLKPHWRGRTARPGSI